MKKEFYTPLEVEVVEIMVEQGIATTPGGASGSDFEDDPDNSGNW